MPYEFNGQTIETDANGFLTDQSNWSEDLAKHIAEQEDIAELTEKHWDMINFLRDEYLNNSGNQPNMRNIVKAMKGIWGGKVDTKSLYELFPLNPDKQASKIGGLPDTKRKGGY